MRLLLPLLIVLALAGCASPTAPSASEAPEYPVRAWQGWDPAVVDSGLVLESTDFANGEEFPRSIELNGFGCDGPNVRPELHWSGVPEGTKSLVITMTAGGGGPTDRWAAFNIDPAVTSIPSDPVEPVGADLAVISGGTTDMMGPCSKKDESWELWFILYALDIELDAETGTKTVPLMIAGSGHVLASAELAGWHTYSAE